MNNIEKGKKNLSTLNRVVLVLNIIGLIGGGVSLGFGVDKIVKDQLGFGITLTVVGAVIILLALAGFLANIYLLIMKKSAIATEGSIKENNDGFGTVGKTKCKNCGTEYKKGDKVCKTCESKIDR